MSPSSPVASAQALRAGYGRRAALEDVSFDIGPGELVAVVGPNGAGKSTLLKVLAGLLKPWSGAAVVLGDQPGRRPLQVAYLPQAEAVDWSFPVSVRDVVLMGRYRRAGWLHRLSRADRIAADRALEQVDMLSLADRQVGALSGGQQRRTFLARAFAQEPDLYLLDEPVTGVDPATEDELMALLNEQRADGKTILASTHDLAGVAEHFTRLLSLNVRLIADGPASLVRDPAVLRATYGGHLIYVEPGAVVLFDDTHHPTAAH